MTNETAIKTTVSVTDKARLKGFDTILERGHVDCSSHDDMVGLFSALQELVYSKEGNAEAIALLFVRKDGCRIMADIEGPDLKLVLESAAKNVSNPADFASLRDSNQTEQ